MQARITEIDLAMAADSMAAEPEQRANLQRERENRLDIFKQQMYAVEKIKQRIIELGGGGALVIENKKRWIQKRGMRP